MILNTLFFLFPFFIYSGIALQAASFYTIGLLAPFLFLLFKHRAALDPYFLTIGLCFVLLYAVFPVTNILDFFFSNPIVAKSFYTQPLSWPHVLKNGFPSAVLLGGIVLCLMFLMSKKRMPSLNHTAQHEHKCEVSVLPSFLTGLSLASLCFLSLLIYQYHTGIDLRSILRKHIEYLGHNDQYASGRFRVYGFYGHPLTAAGVTLTYFVFSWTLLWSWIAKKNPPWDFMPFLGKKYLSLLVLFSIAIANGAGLILTGGRTATMSGLLFFVLIPLVFYARKSFFKLSFFTLVCSVVVFFLVKDSSVFERVQTAIHALVQTESLDQGNNRMIFWKVYAHMIADKPFFGQGSYWLVQGIRDFYYNHLGYIHLTEKFQAHNIYLEILGCTGLFGLIWVVICLWKFMRCLANQVFTIENRLKPVGVAMGLAFLANAIHGLTQNVFLDSAVVYIYLCLLLVCLWQASFSKN